MAGPRVYTTAEWHARPATSTFTKKKALGIVVHNTEHPNRAALTGDAERDKAFSLAKSIQDHHMDGNGWSDTGNHFTISRGGLILEGRHGTYAAAQLGKVVKGAHASGVALYNG